MTLPYKFLDSLKAHEGLRLKPYTDSVGKCTIGYGRNLDDRGISVEEANTLLLNDAYDAWEECERQIAAWPALDEVRRAVLAEMLFNLGSARFLGFKNMLAALDAGDYYGAANQMLDSKWATQVGARAETLAKRMATGEWA